MIEIQMPRPWAERAADEPALLAPPPVTREPMRQAPQMIGVGSALVGKVEHLGRRVATCQQHGEYESAGTRLNATKPIETWTGCHGCRAALEEAERAARATSAAAARRAELEHSLERTALPGRFIGRTFGSYVAETAGQVTALEKLRTFAQDFETHLRRGTTLVLSGGVGTGKSHLAGAVMQAVHAEHLALYVTLMGMVRMVRDTWRKDSERSETHVLADLARVDLLVIDEVGVQYGTDAERLMLFEVLDRRYMDQRPTILLTNLDQPGLKDYVGDRVFDRLREVGLWVKFDWPSHRSKAGAR